MKIVVIAHRSESHALEEFTPELMAEEAKVALTMMSEDFIREIYSRADGKGAVIVVEAESEEAAKARLAELPLAKRGMLTLDLYPLKVYRAIEAMAKS